MGKSQYASVVLHTDVTFSKIDRIKVILRTVKANSVTKSVYSSKSVLPPIKGGKILKDKYLVLETCKKTDFQQ
jgi:hypothetical protein